MAGIGLRCFKAVLLLIWLRYHFDTQTGSNNNFIQMVRLRNIGHRTVSFTRLNGVSLSAYFCFIGNVLKVIALYKVEHFI